MRIDFILSLLFPKRCIGCRKIGSYICVKCVHSIHHKTSLKCSACERPALLGLTHPLCQKHTSLDGVFSFFQYDGVVKKAIKQIKYRYVYDCITTVLATIPNSTLNNIESICNSSFEISNCIIVPIPLHASRLRFRGFNQAEKIADLLGKKLHIPVRNDILIRTKNTVPQVSMKSREARIQNMSQVFSINTYCVLHIAYRDMSVILVDDVFTTGATLRAAADVLKKHGVKKVFAITLAQ